MQSKIIIFACLLAISYSHGEEISRIKSGIFSFPKILNLISGRLMGGHNAKPGEFPHQVSLQFAVKPFMSLKHFCGGSILSEKFVLTAAHCIDGIEEIKSLIPKYSKLSFVVKAGKIYLNKTEDSEQLSVVEKALRHEKWNGEDETGPYDLALLKLKTPLRLNKKVASIRLSQKNSEPEGETVLSGWGAITNHTEPEEPVRPKVLQTVFTHIVPRDQCNKAVEIIAAEEGEILKDVIHETNICTGPLDAGISACKGDSGGPLIKKGKDGQPDELVGVVSWGMVPCARKGAPSIYTRVSSFNEWIETNMKKL